jgi:hypothetical protein
MPNPSVGTTPWVFGAGGAVNVPLGGLNLEFEGAGATVNLGGFSGGPGGSFGTSYSFAMIHAFARGGNHAIGVFGGFENPTFLPLWSIGGEAQAYLGHLNLYGQIAYQTTNENLGGTASGWWTRGGVQLFLSDNFFVQGDLRYNSNFFTTGTADTTFAGYVEGRIGGSPWSLFGTARYTVTDSSIGENVTAGLVGIKVNWGNSTLRQQYTTGASMNTIPIL